MGTKQMERRAFAADFEVRRQSNGMVGLRGYAAKFDTPAHGEVVRSSAFNRTLAQRDNVRLLVNHDGVPLASTRAGTMTLAVDSVGLLMDAPDLDPENPTVRELMSAIDRGDIDQMSFAFTPGDAPMVDGVRELREVRLYDVSVVTFPWYEDTSVWATGDRSFDAALVSLRSRETLTEEQRDMILDALNPADDNDGDEGNNHGVSDNDGDEGMRCRSCGRAMSEGMNYCAYCGTPAASDGEVIPPEADTGRNDHVEPTLTDITPAEARALLGLNPAA